MKFRYTTRDLLWLTAVVALAFGWWRDHHETATELSGFYMKTVTIRPVGEDPTKPLNKIGVKMPGTSVGETFPSIMSHLLTGEVQIQLAAIHPVEIGIDAEGYEQMKIVLDRDSETSLTVPLKPIVKDK